MRSLVEACGRSQLQHMGSSSFTTDWNWAFCTGSPESQPPGPQGTPSALQSLEVRLSVQPTLKGGLVCFTSLRVEYLPKLFGIQNRWLASSHPFIYSTFPFISVWTQIIWEFMLNSMVSCLFCYCNLFSFVYLEFFQMVHVSFWQTAVAILFVTLALSHFQIN